MPDFSTHLRTVHFTLVLACVITIASIMGEVGTEVERAHQQLLKVIQITKDWNLWLNQWAREEAGELVKAGIDQWTKVPSSINVCLPSPQNWQFQLRGSPLQFYFEVQRRGQVRVLANAVRKSDGTLPFYPPAEPWPVTLDDFKAFWDSVHHIIFQAVDRIEPTLYFVHTGGAVDDHVWTTTPCDATSSSSLDLQWRDDKVCSARVRGVPQLTEEFFCGDIPKKPITIAVPVVIRNQPVWSNLRSWLVNKYNLQAAGVGFEKDFTALSKVTTHYAELKLPQVQLVLEAELQRSGERVQLVGLNIPRKILSLATVFIILGLQVYLWLHLWKFQPSDKDTEVAWIALYDNRVARIATLVTGVILPFGTIIYVMCTYFFFLNVTTAIHITAVILSIWLAYRSSPLLWQLPTRARFRYVPVHSRWAFSVIWKDFWRQCIDFFRSKAP
jgi:hypothetical protein